MLYNAFFFCCKYRYKIPKRSLPIQEQYPLCESFHLTDVKITVNKKGETAPIKESCKRLKTTRMVYNLDVHDFERVK